MDDAMRQGARFTPFVPKDRYEWIEGPEGSNFEGFAAEVRVNLLNGEIHEYLDDVREIELERVAMLFRHADEQKAVGAAFTALVEGDRDEGATTAHLQARGEMLKRHKSETIAIDRKTHGLIAPHIRDWNAYKAVDGAAPTKIPPPQEGGAASFQLIDPAMTEWLVETVATAYRSGKGVAPPSKPPNDSAGPTPELNSGPQMASE